MPNWFHEGRRELRLKPVNGTAGGFGKDTEREVKKMTYDNPVQHHISGIGYVSPTKSLTVKDTRG
jgi:hypothetical protein